MWSDSDVANDGIMIDVWFPENRFAGNWGDIPLTNPEILKLIPELTGKNIVTVNEIVILMFLREVRLGRMGPDLELYCGDTRMAISKRGEIIDHWDGTALFETGFHMRFS
jgi:hypothetical protein